MSSFHITEVTQEHVTYEAGDVLRDKLATRQYPFCDCVIMGFDGKGYARVCRPYVYVSGVGTTGPNPLLGYETWEIAVHNLHLYEVIAKGRTT